LRKDRPNASAIRACYNTRHGRNECSSLSICMPNFECLLNLPTHLLFSETQAGTVHHKRVLRLTRIPARLLRQIGALFAAQNGRAPQRFTAAEHWTLPVAIASSSLGKASFQSPFPFYSCDTIHVRWWQIAGLPRIAGGPLIRATLRALSVATLPPNPH
jgi:hypothetical protein